MHDFRKHEDIKDTIPAYISSKTGAPRSMFVFTDELEDGGENVDDHASNACAV